LDSLSVIRSVGASGIVAWVMRAEHGEASEHESCQLDEALSVSMRAVRRARPRA
jgi:hypothetical protein